MPIVDASIEVLEEMINRYLALDDNALESLAPLHGKVIAFHINGPDFHLYFIPSPARLQLFSRIEGEPDCTIKGSLFSLAKLSGEDKNGQLFGGDVEMSGDAALAHRFGQILAAIDIDWEEHLSRVVGDIPAHHFSRNLRDFFGWTSTARNTIEQNVAEYLQEELGTLPHPESLQDFYDDVDRLRDDIERLEARVQRLQQQTSVSKS